MDNFKDLQSLNIRSDNFSFGFDKGLNAIWRMPKLVSFSYVGWFDKKSWIGSFTAPNTSVKNLSIQGTDLVEEIVIACAKNFPNIINLEILDVSEPSFRYIQEIAENCDHLRVLSLSLAEEMPFEKVLKYKPWKTPAFQKLIELKLRSNFLPPTDFFFKYLKAPNLNTISFDLSVEVSHSDRTSFCSNMRKVISSLYSRELKISFRFKAAPNDNLEN